MTILHPPPPTMIRNEENHNNSSLPKSDDDERTYSMHRYSRQVLNELQRTVCFSAYETVLSRRSGSNDGDDRTTMTQDDDAMEAKVAELCLGSTGVHKEDDNFFDYTKQCVAGVMQFSALYDDQPFVVQQDDDDDAPTTSRRKLKDCFVPQDSEATFGMMYTGTETGITYDALWRKDPLDKNVDLDAMTTNKSPKDMIRMAKQVITNGKKAMECVMDSNSDYRHGTLPCWRTMKDYHLFVRQQMYVKLQGKAYLDDDDAEAKDPLALKADASAMVVGASSMPEDYWFVGMMAFFLWGWVVEGNMQKYRSPLFRIMETKRNDSGVTKANRKRKSSSSSRSTSRTNRRHQASADDDTTTTTCPFPPGLTLDQQLEIAKLMSFRAAQSQRSMQQGFDTKLAFLDSRIKSHLQMMELWVRIHPEQKQEYLDKINALMEEKEALLEQYMVEREKVDEDFDEMHRVMEYFAPHKRRCILDNHDDDDE